VELLELEQAKKRVEELRAVIEKNNRLYYDQDAPELEDFEYDALTRELKELEAQFPQLVTASSPTPRSVEALRTEKESVRRSISPNSPSEAISVGFLSAIGILFTVVCTSRIRILFPCGLSSQRNSKNLRYILQKYRNFVVLTKKDYIC